MYHTNCVCFWWSDCAFALPSRAERYRFTTRLVWVGRPHCRFGSTHGAACRGPRRGWRALRSLCVRWAERSSEVPREQWEQSACEGVLCLVCCCTHTDAQKRESCGPFFFAPSLRAPVLCVLYSTYIARGTSAYLAPVRLPMCVSQPTATPAQVAWLGGDGVISHTAYIYVCREGAEH